jgi:hypothetical protein
VTGRTDKLPPADDGETFYDDEDEAAAAAGDSDNEDTTSHGVASDESESDLEDAIIVAPNVASLADADTSAAALARGAKKVKPVGGVSLAQYPLLNLCGGAMFLRHSAQCEDPLGEAAMITAELNAALAAATASRLQAASASTATSSSATATSSATAATGAGAIIVACARITGQVRTAVDRLSTAATASGADAKQMLLMSVMRAQEPYLDAARDTLRRFLLRGECGGTTTTTSSSSHATPSMSASDAADGGLEEDEERKVEQQCEHLLQLAARIVFFEALERTRASAIMA